MQNNITEEQLLIYARGPKKGRVIIDNNLPDHYRTSFKKYPDKQAFMWNWSAFFLNTFWFAIKGMPFSFFISFLGTVVLATCAGLLLSTYGVLLTWIISSFMMSCLGEQCLIRRLKKKIQQNNFDDLSEEIKSAFITKVGMTEQQYLSCIYGEVDASTLMKYNAPDHYRQAFKKFASGKKFVWNWASGILTAYWLLYRKLPHYALMSIFLALLMFTYPLKSMVSASKILLTNPKSVEAIADILTALATICTLNLLSIIILGLLGNRLLLSNTSKQIHQNNYAFFSRKGGETGVVLTSILFGWLAAMIYQLINYINGWETWLISKEIISMIPFVVALVYTQHKIREYKKSAKT